MTANEEIIVPSLYGPPEASCFIYVWERWYKKDGKVLCEVFTYQDGVKMIIKTEESAFEDIPFFKMTITDANG